ncbi:hypothetical protein F5Y14DRAFT_447975 [Nemania sp. NC0429]|nr:hypothetical protein F5Y14DRAFT_447975 [Nemania sp. NC0429]
MSDFLSVLIYYGCDVPEVDYEKWKTCNPNSSPGPSTKPVHSLVLDTGPLIKDNRQPIALGACAEQLYILPFSLLKIDDTVTRSHV